VLADWDLVPDLDVFISELRVSFDELRAAAGLARTDVAAGESRATPV
jgi:hypothetical protein